MIVRYRPRRNQAQIRRDMKKSGPVARILQGLFILAVGVVIMAVNLSTISSPFQKVTGHITETDEHLVNGAYDASYLQIDTSSDIFIFDRNAFHPVWNDQVYKRQRVDVYYQDGTPKKVVALELYDLFGGPSTRFTTAEYDTAIKNPSNPSLAFIIGALIALAGLLWIARSVWILVMPRLSSRTQPTTMNASLSQSYVPLERNGISATMPPPKPQSITRSEQEDGNYGFREY